MIFYICPLRESITPVARWGFPHSCDREYGAERIATIKNQLEYHRYIRSKAWQEKRQAKLEACDGICECNAYGDSIRCSREATQIHHLDYDSLGDENLDSLQALCRRCHMAVSPKARHRYSGGMCCKPIFVNVERSDADDDGWDALRKALEDHILNQKHD